MAVAGKFHIARTGHCQHWLGLMRYLTLALSSYNENETSMPRVPVTSFSVGVFW